MSETDVDRNLRRASVSLAGGLVGGSDGTRERRALADAAAAWCAASGYVPRVPASVPLAEVEQAHADRELGRRVREELQTSVAIAIDLCADDASYEDIADDALAQDGPGALEDLAYNLAREAVAAREADS